MKNENQLLQEISYLITIFESAFLLLHSDKFHHDEAQMKKLYASKKISEELGISRVQLYRKVKEISGLSPVDYLRNFRLSKAATLLNHKRYSVSEVAYRAGFSSPAYFAKCFKSVFNMTPSEYISE